MRNSLLPALAAAGLGLGAALAAAPASAQTVSELIVTAPWSGHGPAPRELSTNVSYADLDLRNPGDRRVLHDRIEHAAYRVCDRINAQPRSPHNLNRSCQDRAMRDAMAQMSVAVATAEATAPRYAVVAPPPPAPEVAYEAPTTEPPAAEAPSATSYGQQASVTVQTVTNGPVPDTTSNRARFGGPMSNAGKRTAARGN